ncbi:uncharacterized protein [Dermacentor albipictus]|uniref:uncharacterized protein isoform X1 n=1 Tax=Dermacentor albipictus TaxID=60249 RepID=UPI0038FCBFD2
MMANTSGKPIERQKKDLNAHEVLSTLYLEASKMQAQMHESRALQELKYLKPSEIGKQKDKMDAAVNKLVALEKQVKESHEREGTDIVVPKKWAKDSMDELASSQCFVVPSCIWQNTMWGSASRSEFNVADEVKQVGNWGSSKCCGWQLKLCWLLCKKEKLISAINRVIPKMYCSLSEDDIEILHRCIQLIF